MINDERRKKLGEEVRRLREKQNWSQRDFADIIGTSQAYVWEIETGRVSVGFDIMCKIADSFDIYVYELIDDF